MMMETPPPPVGMDTEHEAPPPLDVPSSQSQPELEPAASTSPLQESQVLDPEPESGPMLYLSESLQESPEEADPTPHSEQKQLETEPVPDPDPVLEPAAGPSKPKRDRLSRLKELGLDPPPVAKLCPDDGAFVQLEAPQTNPGEFCSGSRTGPFVRNLPVSLCSPSPGVEALRRRYLRHLHAPVRPAAERSIQLTVIRKDSAPSGQEELRAESLTVTLKEGREESGPTKPGLIQHLKHL